MDTPNLKTIASGFLGLLSSFGSGDPPTIDGYTFRGLGFCENAQGSYYSYDTIPGIQTPEECATACTEQYSSDEKYVGINFHPAWFGSPNCNCMMMNLWSSGKIAGANGWNEELCYSWDEAQGLPPTPETKEPNAPQGPEVPAPSIGGYEFRGMGCCENSMGSVYGYDTVPGDTIEQCAVACKETYSSDEYFVGINFHPNWFGSANCNCMKDKTWSGEAAGNGKITGAGGWCHEEYCYSYNEADPPGSNDH